MTRAVLTVLACLVGAVACASPPSSSGAPGRSDAGVVALERDDAAEIPCAPRRVLQEVCQRCHARPLRGGAPLPLERRSDLLATYGGIAVRELAVEQLEARRMPLTPVTLQDDARAVLLAWLRDGAPAITPSACGADEDAGAPEAGAADAGAGDGDAGEDAGG